MINRLTKFTLFFIIVISTLIIYLSFFGVSTKKFNDTIKSEVLNLNKDINLELKTVKLILDPFNLTINVKTFEPKIIINKSELELEYIKTNISLKSLMNKEFSIDDVHISTKRIKLESLILLVRSFKNSPQLFILDNIIKGGFLIGDIKLNFDSKGKVKNDYEIKGFLKKGKLDILRKYSIKDLNLLFNIKNNKYSLVDIGGVFNNIKLSSQLISIEEKNKKFFVKGKFENKKKDINIEILNKLFEKKLKDNGFEKINFSSNNDFSFNSDKKLRIDNFRLKSEINLDKLIYKKSLAKIRKYLPNFEDNIKLENHKISIIYKKNNLSIKGKGAALIEGKADYIEYKLDKKKLNYNFDIIANLKKNSVSLGLINYKKIEDLDSSLKIRGSYNNNKIIVFDSIYFLDNERNVFEIESLNLSEDFKINSIKKIYIDFINNNDIKNQISLKKDKEKYKIYGKSFDVSRLISEILDDNNDNDNESFSIFNNFNTNFSVNINKTYLDKDTYVNDLNGSIVFKNNKIDKINLDSSFSNKKKLTLTINTNDNNEKITTLFSGYPKPLVKQYKFIKGFEEGVLDFYSIKKNEISNSVLVIDNFKVQEVPILAKLLTLASLQGIADLLTGEGIRFTDFEMKFSNEKKLTTIEEMYAIGPAISILMDGYIESKKLTSLRGTLVPATTINRTIASIPLIGKILVGKKTGEGVFGVSFKVKGPPNNLKTTVNPIKTLTPRFITRTLEKIKKN